MLVTAVVALLLLLFLRTRPLGTGILLRLPSTALHELSHWSIAVLCRCSPSAPSIIPKKLGKGRWQLGHVEFIPHMGRACSVAMAPAMICFPMGVWLLGVAQNFEVSTEVAVLLGVLAGYVLDACTPSQSDFAIAFKDPLGIPVAVCVFYFATMWALGSIL